MTRSRHSARLSSDGRLTIAGRGCNFFPLLARSGSASEKISGNPHCFIAVYPETDALKPWAKNFF